MNRRAIFGFLLAFVAALAAPAFADDTDAATAPAFAFVKAFNAGDAKGIAATGAPGTQLIIDDFAPFSWSGPDALSRWYAGFLNDIKAQGITDVHATLEASPYTIVAGDLAWAPLHMNYTYKIKGAPGTEHGLITFALKKAGGEWLITVKLS